MSSEGSISRHLGAFQAGQRDALQRLWEAFFPRLVRLARTQLQGRKRGQTP